MIDGEYNIYLIDKNSKDINKFVGCKKTDEELSMQYKLTALLIDFYQSVCDEKARKLKFYYDFVGYGYSSDQGYYVITEDLNNNYEVVTTNEIALAFFMVTKNIIERLSSDNLGKNKKKNKREYKDKYPDIKDVMNLYEIEFAIKSWDKYYDGNIPDEIINKYLDTINRFDERINASYNKETKELEVTKLDKGRTLKID